MSRIKVAHVANHPYTFLHLLLNQLQSVQQAGYEVACISSPGPGVAALEGAGMRHIAVPLTRNVTPRTDAAAVWHLARMMRRERFTIVHTHNPKPGLLGQLAARLAGVPIVLNTLHGFFFHEHMGPLERRFYITMEKVAARCSDAILSQNSEDIQTAIDTGICPPTRIKHLGNGIDLSVFDPARFNGDERRRLREQLGLPTEAKVIGFVGRLAGRRKGVLDLLAAGERVIRRDPNARFLIIGEPDHGKPDAVELATIEGSLLGPYCRCLGWRPNAELPHLYQLMDVLVLPSLFEGMPRAIMEAAAMGVPTVATAVKGNREAVEQGRTGLLVPLGDVQALADAILDLLVDRERARQMGEAARRLASARFDERLVFEKVTGEYARLLRERGLPLPLPSLRALEVLA